MKPRWAFREFVSAGTWCVDHNKLIGDWPAETNAMEIIDVQRSGGGSACNFGVDLKLLDPKLNISTMGMVGDDDDGRFLMEMARRHGLESSGLRVAAGERTAFTDAYASQLNGRRTHFFASGVNATMTPEDFDFTDKQGCLLHLGLPGAHAALDRPNGGDATGWVTVLRKAKAAGMTTNTEVMSIKPDEIARLNRPNLPFLDMLIVNDGEIGALAGRVATDNGQADIAACRAAAADVLAAGAMELVVVHHPGGAFCLTRDGGDVDKPSVNVPSSATVGSNGAGDAFAAGFVCGLAHTVSIGVCLAYAHAAAAASLRDTTTTGAVMAITQCLALADQWGWR